MKNIKTNHPEIVCLPFSGVTPFHKKYEKNWAKTDVKSSVFPSMGGYRFF
ncbi:MAG: hypothetical protein PQJ61_09475 [Spirochaetales bacterium]|uniref:Uncharacterized protein n=1 Tax=Candidatus Thalassospirochaeta sargassi TaxID=3119039 RepID=A0AAJ1IGS6_9SPIO|nr:hypothetical protein [Spirochaetales bacterium]